MPDIDDIVGKPPRDWSLVGIVSVIVVVLVVLSVSFIAYDNTHGDPTLWPLVRLVLILGGVASAAVLLVGVGKALGRKQFRKAAFRMATVVLEVMPLIWLLHSAGAF